MDAQEVLTDAEIADASKLCEAALDFLKDKAKELVKEAGPRPVLYSYGSDSTPCLGRFTLRRRLESRTWLVRTGQQSNDFLLEKGSLRYIDALGHTVQRFLARDPRTMKNKTDPAYFMAFREFFPQLKTLQHKGISITHLSFDGYFQRRAEIGEVHAQGHGGPGARE